jgi:hypothetical protein
MRWSLVIAASLVFACGPANRATPHAATPAARDPSGADASTAAPAAASFDPMVLCDRAAAALDRISACFPEAGSASVAKETVDSFRQAPPSDPYFRRGAAAICAELLDGMLRQPTPKPCDLGVSEALRREATDFLAAWYAERTAPPDTGNAAADRSLADLAKLRDEACACADMACTAQVDQKLLASLTPLSDDAPTVARDAAGRMIDELSRCRRRVALGASRPGP